jgi:hypothetical protein
LGWIGNKRCAFADGISLAFGDRFAIGLFHSNAIGFTTSIRFTGCIPFGDSVSDPLANGVAEAGHVARSIPFSFRERVKPGFSFDARGFADT